MSLRKVNNSYRKKRREWVKILGDAFVPRVYPYGKKPSLRSFKTENNSAGKSRLRIIQKLSYEPLGRGLAFFINRRSIVFYSLLGYDTSLDILHGWQCKHNIEHGRFHDGT